MYNTDSSTALHDVVNLNFVQYLPQEVCRFVTAFHMQINLFDADMGIVYKAHLHVPERNMEEEAYIGVGWYEMQDREG